VADVWLCHFLSRHGAFSNVVASHLPKMAPACHLIVMIMSRKTDEAKR